MSIPTSFNPADLSVFDELSEASPDIAVALHITESYHRFTPWFELADWARRRESVASFLLGVALATLKDRALFREQLDPETGRPFASFAAYARYRFPNVQDDEGIDLTTKEVHRLAKIGHVYLENRELFESKGFDPYGNYSKLLFWGAARHNHPELSESELYDKLVETTKQDFESFANGVSARTILSSGPAVFFAG